MVRKATIVMVPGLRDAVTQHWQTLLEADLRSAGQPVVAVPPMGRENLDCAARVAAIEHAAQSLSGPLVIVAHSGGCIMVARWAMQSGRAVQGALLATPPDFDAPMPAGYPTSQALAAGGWFPVPRQRLPFRSLVALSSNDPLGRHERVLALAGDWGSEPIELGEVGHLNPASGYGPWPLAKQLIDRLL